jgi:hypothetical protein
MDLGDRDAVDGLIEVAVALLGGAQPDGGHTGGVRDGGQAHVAGEGRLALEPLNTGHLRHDPRGAQFSAPLQGQERGGRHTDTFTDAAVENTNVFFEPGDVAQFV